MWGSSVLVDVVVADDAGMGAAVMEIAGAVPWLRIELELVPVPVPSLEVEREVGVIEEVEVDSGGAVIVT